MGYQAAFCQQTVWGLWIVLAALASASLAFSFAALRLYGLRRRHSLGPPTPFALVTQLLLRHLAADPETLACNPADSRWDSELYLFLCRAAMRQHDSWLHTSRHLA